MQKSIRNVNVTILSGFGRRFRTTLKVWRFILINQGLQYICMIIVARKETESRGSQI